MNELVNVLNSVAPSEESKLKVDTLFTTSQYFEQDSNGQVNLVVYHYISGDDARYSMSVPVESVRHFFTDEFKSLDFK
jgi:hypothetical protein